jgi:hypothetical protein
MTQFLTNPNWVDIRFPLDHVKDRQIVMSASVHNCQNKLVLDYEVILAPSK